MLSLCFSRLDSSVSRLSRSLARSAFLSRDSGGENTFTRLPLSDSRFDPSIHSCSRFQEIESDSLITVFTAEKGKRREERGGDDFPLFPSQTERTQLCFPFPSQVEGDGEEEAAHAAAAAAKAASHVTQYLPLDCLYNLPDSRREKQSQGK